MDFYSPFAVSFALLLAATWMIRSHLRTWKAARGLGLDAEEFDYRRRQFRRRVQTSAMMAVLAAALAAGYAATIWWFRSALFATLFWLGVMLLACWIGLLALADIWATSHYFGRRRHDNLVERIKLEAELRRMEDRENKKRNT